MKKLLFSLFLVVLSCNVYSQSRSREFIRDKIREKGECRNVAITKYNGDLMLYGQNGWASTGCPKSLNNALDELNEENEYIRDVQLTDDGSWLILYGNNGARWNDIPSGLERKLREFNDNREVITSATFNDDGDWIIITEDHFSASDPDIRDFIREGMEKYGGVYTACITDDALVIVYEEGFRTIGEVPDDLMPRLRKAEFDVYHLKIAGTAWFFSDGKRHYDYHM